MSRSALTKQRSENRILAALPTDDFDRLQVHLEPVSLGADQVLYEPGQKVEYVYFPTRCQLFAMDRSGIQLATVGREGMAGLRSVLGAEPSRAKIVVQVPGEAFRMKVQVLRDEVAKRPKVNDVLNRFTIALMTQLGQSVVCNAIHTVKQRCCRWLLMISDRAPAGPRFPLTQELLADMLGVRRASVSVEARRLLKAGILVYSRGMVGVVNRKGLEAGSCECYRIVKEEYDRLLG